MWKDLRASDSPPGETIGQYVAKELKGHKHEGETPPQIIAETLAFSKQAAQAIDAAAPHVTKNAEEFKRLRTDIHAIRLLTQNYTHKAEAALRIVRCEHTKDPKLMAEALSYLERSFQAYQKLNELAGPHYRYVPSYHGRQRIPWNGAYHWSQLVDRYRKELDDLRREVARSAGTAATRAKARAEEKNIKPLPPAKFKLLTKGIETYDVKVGATVFTDRDYAITDLAPELKGLTGIRFSHGKAKKGGRISIELEAPQPVKLLVGYFRSRDKLWLQVPQLEHVAHAADRGGYEPKIRNAVTIAKLPAVHIHAFRYDKGRQTVEMIGKGSYVILGVIPASAKIAPRDAARSGGG